MNPEAPTTELQRGTTPPPGIYRDVPSEMYHSWRAASSHVLTKIIDKSPAHVMYGWTHPEARTEAMRIGDALHTLVLEPSAFDARYSVSRKCDAVTGKGDPCKHMGSYRAGNEWFCGTHAKAQNAVEPTNLLPGDELEVATSMADAVKAHAMTANLLRLSPATTRHPADGNEVTVVWDRLTMLSDGTTYLLRCKLRADILRPGLGIVADIKSTDSAGPEAFARSCAKYGYHRQAAHYLDGIRAAGIEGIEHYAFIVPEKKPPHTAAFYRIDAESLECGRREIGTAYQRFAECERDNKWPGYSEEFQALSLPSWRLKQAGM